LSGIESLPALQSMQMKLIKQDAAATLQPAAAFPGKHGDKLPSGMPGVELLTAAMWQAMQEYAACLTALTIPGLAEEELKQREASCLLHRANYLEAKGALEACVGATRPATDDKADVKD
jgi:hypothetical protein